MKKSVRVVKRNKRSGSEREVKVPLVRNKLSKSIQSWVVEFRKKEQEQLPGFDSLFTDKVPSVESKNVAGLPKSGERDAIDRFEKVGPQLESVSPGNDEQSEPNNERLITRRNSQGFLMPTAEELGRLALDRLSPPVSVQTQASANCFAGLLNEGSSQE